MDIPSDTVMDIDDEYYYVGKRGEMLTVYTDVVMATDNHETGAVGAGTIVWLPRPGSNHHGFPLVQFDHDGGKRHVAATELLVNKTASVTLTNRYGTFTATPDELDAAIILYLPDTQRDLAYRWRQVFTTLGTTYPDDDALTTTELLIMIVHAERFAAQTGTSLRRRMKKGGPAEGKA